MDVVSFTKVSAPYGWLGNMAPYPVDVLVGFAADGQPVHETYRTSEAAFQALRFKPDDDVRRLIREQKSPMAAKMVAKSHADKRFIVPMSDDDISLMDKVLRLKLKKHPRLQKELLATGEALIIEDCTRRRGGTGLFWGAAKRDDGTWEGKNCLGLLWVNLRNELRDGNGI